MKQGICAILLLISAIAFSANPPSVVNYQGVLRDSAGKPLSGTYDIVFRLYDASTAGNEILVDSHTAGGSNAITVSNGIFSTMLGGGSVSDGAGSGTYTSISSAFESFSSVWVEISVSGQILSPRIRVASSPFSFRSKISSDSELLGGVTAAALEESSEIDTKIAAHAAIPDAHHPLQSLSEIDLFLSQVDTDGDGIHKLSQGGTDCNDTDNSIHPGAFDIRFDGVDQDCSGADRTNLVYSSITTYGDANYQSGRDMVVSGNNIFIGGRDNGDALILRYANPPSTPVWTATWGGAEDANGEWAQGIAVNGTSNTYISGTSWNFSTDGVGGKESKSVAAGFTTGGATPDWYHSPNFYPYTGGEGFGDLVYYNGELYSAGQAQANGANYTAIIANHTASGSLDWWQPITSTGSSTFGFATDILELGGYLYITGFEGPSAAYDPFVAKYDTSGLQSWKQTFNFSTGEGIAHGICKDGTYVYVVGDETSSGNRDLFFLKYDTAGNLVWSNGYSTAGTQNGYGCTFDPVSGRLLVVGQTDGSGVDALLVEVDTSNGSVLNTVTWGGTSDDRGYDVAVIGSDVFVAGDTNHVGSTSGDLALVRLR